MSPRILHISDLHAHGGNPRRSLVGEIAESVRDAELSTLVVSGDFGHQGSGHQAAARWVADLAGELGVQRNRIVCCPGNHDLRIGGVPSFNDYTRAVAELTGRASRAQPDPAMYYEIDGIGFLVLNTVYHLDHSYGLVLVEEIQRVLAANESASPIVCVMHHHFIPQRQSDRSAVANAYDLLTTLAEYPVVGLLHGHRHMAMTVRIGEIRAVGVGSVSFEPERNVNNQFNVIEVGAGVERFRLIEDSTGVAANRWVPTYEPW